MTENIYNMLGEVIYTYNIDSGRRWILNDVAGKPIRKWDNQHRELHNEYDALQRPLGVSLWLSGFVAKTERIGYESYLPLISAYYNIWTLFVIGHFIIV